MDTKRKKNVPWVDQLYLAVKMHPEFRSIKPRAASGVEDPALPQRRSSKVDAGNQERVGVRRI